MKLIIDDTIIAENCIYANNFIKKLLGKTFAKYPVILKNCNSIHTIFLRENIDIIFLNKTNNIIKIYQNVPPFKIIPPVFKAKHTIEFDADFIKNAKIKLGQKILFKK